MTDSKKITQLTPGVTLTGNELLEMVQAGNSRSVRTDQFPLATDSFVTVSNVGLLPNSRYLDAGAGISLIDGGPGSTLTINATGVTFDSATFVVLSLDGVFPNERVLSGTVNQVILTDGGPLGNITLSLPQDVATTSSPTFTNLTLTNPLPPTSGGTGIASYAVGDLLYASGAATMARLADVAAGSYLRSGGISTAPQWSAVTIPNSATTGDLLYASNTNTYSNLTDVATGSYLRSGGIGTAPLWSTTTLPNTAVQGDLIYANAANAFVTLAKDTSATRYLSNTGTTNNPAWAQVNLANGVTGDLPFANLTQITGLSVLGVAGNVAADVAAITASNDGEILRRSGTSIGFGAISLTSVNFSNPSANVGLTAVNGSSVTAMRSDGAPALSQSIAPTWSGLHTFTNNPGILISSTAPALRLFESDATTNNKYWQSYAENEQLRFSVLNDALNAEVIWLSVDRTANVIDRVVIPNSRLVAQGNVAGTIGTTLPGVHLGTDVTNAGSILWSNSGGATDEKLWRAGAGFSTAHSFNFQILDDAYTTGVSWLDVIRSANTISTITFPNGNVGVGTAPSFLLDVQKAGGNTAFTAARFANSSSTGTAYQSRISISGAAYGLDIGNTGNPTSHFGGLAGNFLGCSASNPLLFAQGATVRFYMDSGGSITWPTLGVTTSAANGHFDSASSPPNNMLRSTSSLRYKRDIEDIEDGLFEGVLSLRPVWYRSLCAADRKDWSWYGLIAEEVANLDPRLCHWIPSEADPNTLIPDGVQYERVAVLTLGFVQRQAKIIRALEKRISTLESA